MGEINHLVDVVTKGNADAVAMAHVLHYQTLGLSDIRHFAREQGLPVRIV